MENNAYSAQQAARPEYLIVSQWLQAFRVVVSDFAKQELMACIRREIEQAERRAEAMREDAERWRHGVLHGFPRSSQMIHPTIGPVKWRTPKQEPPNGEPHNPADYPSYESPEAAIDAARTVREHECREDGETDDMTLDTSKLNG